VGEEIVKGSRKKLTRCYSPRVTLAAAGLKISSLKLLDPIKRKVVILQKRVVFSELKKLTARCSPLFTHIAWDICGVMF